MLRDSTFLAVVAAVSLVDAGAERIIPVPAVFANPMEGLYSPDVLATVCVSIDDTFFDSF